MTFTRPGSSHYQAYLLRLWRDGPDQPWRVSLQGSATETLHHFADLQRLFAFLQAQTEGDAKPADPGASPEA
jgi:hypothetical protein